MIKLYDENRVYFKGILYKGVDVKDDMRIQTSMRVLNEKFYVFKVLL